MLIFASSTLLIYAMVRETSLVLAFRDSPVVSSDLLAYIDVVGYFSGHCRLKLADGFRLHLHDIGERLEGEFDDIIDGPPICGSLPHQTSYLQQIFDDAGRERIDLLSQLGLEAGLHKI